MEEIDTDEYLAMLEEKARKENPEEEYQMYMAWRLGSLQEEIDKLETFITNLIGKLRQQREDMHDKNKHKVTQMNEFNSIQKDCKKEITMSKKKNEKATHVEEACQRAEKVKVALLSLESDLRLFRDGNEVQRNIFRKELDPGDVGYVGCLLTALTGDEAQFDRWLTFSTYKYNFFRRKGMRR